MIRESYLAAAEAAWKLLADPAVAQAWDAPSALAGYRVAGLAGHLAGQVNVVAKVLDGPELDPAEQPITALDHLLTARWLDGEPDGEVHLRIRASGDDYAQAGPQALADRTADVLDRLRRELPGQPEGRAVQFPWGPPALLLDDLLLNRLMELVVHLDDLAVSVGLPTPELPSAATDAVVGLLATLAARRHGPVALVRALTRAERAPGTIAAF